MRRSAMIASHPWTLLITLEEDPDSLGCWVQVQELNLDGGIADHWVQHFDRVADALLEMERAYGIGPSDWVLST